MLKILRTLAVLTILPALLLSACGGADNDGSNGGNQGAAGSDGAPEAVTLRLAHVGSETHQYQIAAEKFKELVEAETDGAVRIDIFNNGVLGNEDETMEQVLDGTLDIAAVVADSSFANIVPEMNVFGIPYLFRDLEHVYATLDGEVGQDLIALADAKDMKFLGFWEIGLRQLTNSKREVAEPSDLEGLKIRVQPSPVWEAHMSALGASATPIAFNELYSAMDQGVVDGQENPLNTIYSMKFYEVQQYLSLTNHTYSPAAVAMSTDTWESLTEAQQGIVEEAFLAAQQYQREELARINATILDEIKETGVVVTEPDIAAFREATRNVKDVLSKQVPAELIERIEAVN
ncbi:TRAP transporter substrate-binding protein [Paenibacillus sp. IB182496]|uniref:TRAP transporter substrate-binding protein n=1 Tax=Paenibacillus sabuli TaxID=2772509 RepID=A0A927BQP5_9BACL|nr:TRAP transporter substrate-binding protein [Paenibacillus sabuli]MBD2844176.1 TRAP transporter substrate-binding protein [Paenibacillus sabuli]